MSSAGLLCLAEVIGDIHLLGGNEVGLFENVCQIVVGVIMPEMGGEELVGKIKEINPKMKIIYTSGYTDDFITTEGIIDSKCHFISKPFTLKSIGEKVRLVLDEKEIKEEN